MTSANEGCFVYIVHIVKVSLHSIQTVGRYTYLDVESSLRY